MRTKPLQSPRLLKKRRKRIIMRIVLSVCALVAVIALPALLLRLSFWNIRTIEVSGIKAVSETDVRSAVESKLEGTYFHIFPRSNIVIYPKRSIEETVKTSLQRIDGATVKRKSLSSIEVSISERAPVALWCGSASSSDCYFLDKSGLIFDRSPEFSNNVYVTYSGNVSGEPIGKYFAESAEFSRVQDFVQAVKSLALSPFAVTAMPNNDYRISLPKGEEILFTTRESLEETVSNLQSVLSDPKHSVRSGDSLSVTSIDLPFGNKVEMRENWSTARSLKRSASPPSPRCPATRSIASRNPAEAVAFQLSRVMVPLATPCSRA